MLRNCAQVGNDSEKRTYYANISSKYKETSPIIAFTPTVLFFLIT